MDHARFKYEFLNGRVRYVVDEGTHTRLYEVWSDQEPKLIEPHPSGIWSRTASLQAIKNGLPASDRVGHDLLRRFEDESVPKRYVGGWLYEATVTYEGEAYDVTVQVFQRKVIRLSKRVTKFATAHAVQRAKERYDLVLDAETAETMVNKLLNGHGKPVRCGRDGLERVELTYDNEVFTIVWSPEDAVIVTVTPTD